MLLLAIENSQFFVLIPLSLLLGCPKFYSRLNSSYQDRSKKLLLWHKKTHTWAQKLFRKHSPNMREYNAAPSQVCPTQYKSIFFLLHVQEIKNVSICAVFSLLIKKPEL